MAAPTGVRVYIGPNWWQCGFKPQYVVSMWLVLADRNKLPCTDVGRDFGASNIFLSQVYERRSSKYFDRCKRSRMGDAFRPPSPTPFGVVMEAAPIRERERDCVRQNNG